MKRISISVGVMVVLFFFIGSALGASTPPKKGCFSMAGYTDVIAFVVKGVGKKLPMQEGKTKFYQILGEVYTTGVYSMPLMGSGHMDGDTFHFALQGQANIGGFMFSLVFEGTWDVVAEEGLGRFQLRGPNEPDLLTPIVVANQGNGALTLGNCEEEAIPYGGLSMFDVQTR